MKKQEKKKSDFLKIAQGLGIAIPASLLFATNATPANITVNESIQMVENSISFQEKNEVANRIVWELNTNKKTFDLAKHTNTPHANQGHINRHSDNHTNVTDVSKKSQPHTNTHANGKHTNTPHSDKHTNKIES
jgi:hypothetical protein